MDDSKEPKEPQDRIEQMFKDMLLGVVCYEAQKGPKHLVEAVWRMLKQGVEHAAKAEARAERLATGWQQLIDTAHRRQDCYLSVTEVQAGLSAALAAEAAEPQRNDAKV